MSDNFETWKVIIENSGLFDKEYYLKENPDVEAAGIDPLYHFYTFGWKENRKFNSLSKYNNINWGNANNSFKDFFEQLNSIPNRIYIDNNDVATVADTVNDNDVNQSIILELEETGLFINDWYVSRYPDVANIGINPLEHYVKYGAYEGRWPNPCFDSSYYLNTYRDIYDNNINPLLHYFKYGEKEGRKPSRYFDPIWYASIYKTSIVDKESLMRDFLIRGGKETNPSINFDAIQYYKDHPDVMKANINPLRHFLESGMREGRKVSATRFVQKASEAEYICIKNIVKCNGKVALLVTHSPDGFIRGDFPLYIKNLVKQHIEVILIIASDQSTFYIPNNVFDMCSGIIIRENVGFDFAAWSHTIQIFPKILNADLLMLLNDSIVGPIDEESFSKLIDKINNSKADFVGVTINNTWNTHLQSYFLSFKRSALSNYIFSRYFRSIVNFKSKDDVIMHYEVNLTAHMQLYGLKYECIFNKLSHPQDITIFKWKELCESGFPFIKRSLITGDHKNGNYEEVIDYLKDNNYPYQLISQRIPELSSDGNYRKFVFYKNGYEKLNYSKYNNRRIDNISELKVTFISPVSYSNGLGVAGRGYLASLYNTRMSIDVFPIQKPFHVHSVVAPKWRIRSNVKNSDIALIHINPDGWGGLLDKEHYKSIEKASRRVGLFVWELSTIPKEWFNIIGLLDAVIAPSKYCASIFKKYMDIPIYVVPHVVDIPELKECYIEDKSEIYRKYSIPQNKNIILFIFDGSSFLERKNPQALIRAFKKSGLGEKGWQLVLKTKNLFDIEKNGDDVIRNIDNDPAITLLNKSLNKLELQELLVLCDIYASPHSSEGFGLTVAEAMSYGKVVVATDYGGTKDFLDDICGYPVKAEEVSINETYGPYLAGGKWGMIDEEELSNRLQSAATYCSKSGKGITEIGIKAREAIGKKLSAKTVSLKMEEVLTNIMMDVQYSDRTRKVDK